MVGLPRSISCARGSLHQESVSETDYDTPYFEMDVAPELDGDEFNLILSKTKIRKRLNEQSVGSSISFSVGWKFLTFAFCVAIKVELKDILQNPYGIFLCSIYNFFNGYKKRPTSIEVTLDSSSFFYVV